MLGLGGVPADHPLSFLRRIEACELSTVSPTVMNSRTSRFMAGDVRKASTPGGPRRGAQPRRERALPSRAASTALLPVSSCC